MALKNRLDKIFTNIFKIEPKTTLPTSELEDGMVDIKGGILCIYDEVRGKWLSVQRQTFTFGRSGTTANQYLNYGVGELPSVSSGFRLPRNSCIVGMSVQTSEIDSYIIQLRRNGYNVSHFSLGIVSDDGKSDITMNTDLSINDKLQCYLEYTGVGQGVPDPVVMIELAWRL